MGYSIFPQPTTSAGFDPLAMTVRQTFNSSSNNIAVSGKNWVYALLAGGGGGGANSGDQTIQNPYAGGGAGGGVAFGLVPVNSVAVIGSGGTGANQSSNLIRGGGGGFSTYSGLRANGAFNTYFDSNSSNGVLPALVSGFSNSPGASLPGQSSGTGYPSQYTDSMAGNASADIRFLAIPAVSGIYGGLYPSGVSTVNNGGSGATGAGGGMKQASGAAGSGGNSMTGYTGGAGGVSNTNNAGAGSGGGAGITGNGGAGGSNSTTTPGVGGTGGTGGGGGGCGGSGQGISGAAGGAGGAGALIIYF
jgi:hypothetical protein